MSLCIPCTYCGQDFEPHEDHHRLCMKCWYGRGEETYSAGYVDGRSAGFKEGRRVGNEEGRRPQAPSLGPDLLRDLVKLTHPDRHPPERSELANRTTAALLTALNGGAS